LGGRGHPGCSVEADATPTGGYLPVPVLAHCDTPLLERRPAPV